MRFGTGREKKTEEGEYEEKTNGFRHIRIVAEWRREKRQQGCRTPNR
jgi:hypothetical protein